MAKLYDKFAGNTINNICAVCFTHLAIHNWPLYHIVVYLVKNNISNVQLISVEGVVHNCTFFDLAKYWNLSQGRFLLQWALICIHDNARPHTAGVSMDCLGEEGIDAIDWPACSPDLNPIEHCWDMVDRRVRSREHPPKTVRGPGQQSWMSGRTSLKWHW